MKFITMFQREAELTDETYAKMFLLDFCFNLWDSAQFLNEPVRWYFTDKSGMAMFMPGGYPTAEEAAIAGIKYYTAGNKP